MAAPYDRVSHPIFPMQTRSGKSVADTLPPKCRRGPRLTSIVHIGFDADNNVRAYRGKRPEGIEHYSQYTLPGCVNTGDIVYVATRRNRCVKYDYPEEGVRVVHVGLDLTDFRKVAEESRCWSEDTHWIEKPRYFELRIE